jgi:3-hydroxybutyryl-CoA dehydrogenase
MEIRNYGVIGAGQMGAGIAQVAAAAGGLNVILVDISQDMLEKGKKVIAGNLEKMVSKGKMAAEEKDAALQRILLTTDMARLADADFVVEAATEREDLKFQIFRNIDSICRPEIILASNTSSIPIGRIAAQTKRPDKIIGMHFMNPVPVMKLVEIIRGIATSDETFQTTKVLTEKFGKTPVEANDFPGFILNRILIPMINEAIFTLYHGVGSVEGIDAAMKLGANQPMGPLELADLIGLDTILAIMETLFAGFKDSKYRPCPLLRKYVEAGWLGRKTGKGFYTY